MTGAQHDPWECPQCHSLFERPGMAHEPCWNTQPAASATASGPRLPPEGQPMTGTSLAEWLAGQPAGYQVDVRINGPLASGPYVVINAETADDPRNPGKGWIVLTLQDSSPDHRLNAIDGEFSP